MKKEEEWDSRSSSFKYEGKDMRKYNIIKPDYYDSFSCKGSTCRQTCCGGWSISLTKNEARQLKKLIHNDSSFKEKNILKKLPPEKRTEARDSQIMLNEKNRCPLLDSQGLCSLQCQYGPGSLSETCRFFPRKVYRYHDILLYAMSLGCEKVLEILLDRKESVKLQSGSQYLQPYFPINVVFDNNTGYESLIQMHFDIHNLWIAILQAEDVIIEDRILLLGICIKQINTLIKEKRVNDIHNYIEEYLKSLESAEDVSSLLPKLDTNPLVILNNLVTVDAVYSSSGYDNYLDQIKKNLQAMESPSSNDKLHVGYSGDAYSDMQQQYRVFMKDKDLFMENYMVSFFLFKNFASTSVAGTSLWDNFLFFSWFFSIVKFSITANMPQIKTDSDLIERLVPLFRKWGHNAAIEKAVIKDLHENSNDSLAYAALLIKSC